MEKLEIDAWFTDIRDGNVYCPFEDCTNVFTSSYKLAKHVKNFCCYGEYDGKLPCTHCSDVFKFEQLETHWKHNHKNVVSILDQLKMNITSDCPNEHCKEVFRGGFIESTRYLQHSITCEQYVFKCEKCHKEYMSAKGSKKHCCGVKLTKSEKDGWFENIRDGNIVCPFTGCTDIFTTSYELSEHVKSSCLHGKYDGYLPCTHCSGMFAAKHLKRHWRNTHKDVVSILHMLKQNTSCKCPNYQCNENFEGGFQGCLIYLKHSITCRPLFQCHVCNKEYSTKNILNQHSCKRKQAVAQKIFVSKGAETSVDSYVKKPAFSKNEIKCMIEEWKDDLKGGNLCCPIQSCCNRFFIPIHFVSHLRKESEIHFIFKHIQLIPCPYCERTVHWKLYARHFQNNHREIVNFINSLKYGGTKPCPNYKCKKKNTFSHRNGSEYLQHALHCKALFSCEYCGMETGRRKYLEAHASVCERKKRKTESIHKVFVIVLVERLP